MTRVARLILALIVGLALLTWAASSMVQTTALGWFERDAQSRAELVPIGARPALADAWNDSASLNRQLVTPASDQRVVGAAARNAYLGTRSITPGFPNEFTGAARELTEALIVNPYDVESSSEAMAAALRMSRDEQRDRVRSMRAFLSQFNVYCWARNMLMDAARLRDQERVAGRLAERGGIGAAA